MEHLIEIKRIELNSTLRVLSDAGATTEDATWIRQGRNAELLVEFMHAQPRLGVLWERISRTAIRVNLAAHPKLPFEEARVEWKEGDGWVTVERRGNALYVDGQRVELHLVNRQKAGTVQGYELRRQLQGQRTLHPNVLDALFENKRLIPKSWRCDEQGHSRFIYFFAVGFCAPSGNVYARCLYWHGEWRRDYRWLAELWGSLRPAAVLAS